MSKIAVLGAGPAGLACGYHLLKRGHEVTLYEADDRPGGMSAHFDFDGLDIERFYHFVCTPDESLVELLRDLGIEDRLEWRVGTMGYFYNGELHEWGNPIALLRFPHLSWLSKVRYGAHMYASIRRKSWKQLEDRDAIEWVTSWVGRAAYDVLWRPLFDLKFFEYADNLSADWIRTRIRRLGLSRMNLMREKLGHLSGGSQTLISRLVAEIERLGGSLLLGCGAEEVALGEHGVEGIRCERGFERYDFVASTIPVPNVPRIIPSLPPALKERYARIDSIGVVCVVFKLGTALTRYFWVNTNDPHIEIPGVIEYSNLRPLPDHVVYVPYYLPPSHPKFAQSDEGFVAESFRYLQRINPGLRQDDIKAFNVSRLRYAQPICPPGFRSMLPPIETGIPGLYVADTSYYYPEDRSISESVRLGRRMSDAVAKRALQHTAG